VWPLAVAAQGGEATKMEEGEYFAIETFGSTGEQQLGSGWCIPATNFE